MEKQNVTLSLPKSLIKKAKVFAAKKEKSLSQIMKEALEDTMSKDRDYYNARKRQLKYLAKGFNLGTMGKIGGSREELYDR
jgi:Zn-dependent oligopeptidase